MYVHLYSSYLKALYFKELTYGRKHFMLTFSLMTEFAIKNAYSLYVTKLFIKSEFKVEHMFLQPEH